MLKGKPLLYSIGPVIMMLSLLATTSQVAQAATQYHRLAWDNNPAHSAIVGFSPKFDLLQPLTRDRRVIWGQSTDESLWETVKPEKRVFMGSAVMIGTSTSLMESNIFRGPLINGVLPSYFARLTGLRADSNVFYRVCETQGIWSVKKTVCGQRFWFRTAPTEETPFIFIAGGDTRGGASDIEGIPATFPDIFGGNPGDSNKAGNELISKIRPLFVMHGGDYTNSNSARQWQRYLSEWQITHANDTIDGLPYKQIFPIIPALGNHEGIELDTLCKVFGVDHNQDNTCDWQDTYGAIDVSPLMRAYTLNSEFKSSSRRPQFKLMNAWLTNDLKADHAQHKSKWRIGQYHRPIFPNAPRKEPNYDQFTAWAQNFYDYGMNLVVESDAHIVKSTFPLKPKLASKVFEKADEQGGTTFVGEGSWAAVARKPNNAQGELLLAQGSFNQFKVVTVSKNKMDVRTARFDGNEQRLSATERDKDRALLPKGVNWWSWNYLGKNTQVMTLNKTPQGRSVMIQPL